MPIERPTLQKQFEMFWEMQKHEDNLVNLRTNWTLVTQGVLFAALTAALGLFEKYQFADRSNTPIHWVLFLLCGLGIISCVAALMGIRAAERQQKKNCVWWSSQLVEADRLNGDSLIRDKVFPPVYRHDINAEPMAISQSHIFGVIAAVWVLITLIIIFSPALLPFLKPR